MKALWEQLVQRGFSVMMSGFALSVVGLIMFMMYRYHGGMMRTASSSVVIAGLVIYAFGRILVTIRKRVARAADEAEDEEKK